MGLVSCGPCQEALKRILYIHHGGNVGGAPLSLLYLLQQLDRTLYDPVVLCTSDGPVVERFRAEGIETHVSNGFSDFSHTELVWYGGKLLWQLPGRLMNILPSVIATRRALRRFQPDLVHLNSSTLAASALAGSLEGVPVIWHIREPIAQGYVGIRRACLRRAINRFADSIIAISEHDAAQLIPCQRIRIIHNFVDFKTFDRGISAASTRTKLNISNSHIVVTMLGGCSEPKGTLPFVESLAIVRQQIPNVRFLVVGQEPNMGSVGSVRGWLRRIMQTDNYDRSVMMASAEAISSGDIIFTGVRSDIPHIIAASDILVFPSTVPHFGRPIIEAGAMAKPVVVSDIGGAQELVVHGETGLLVPPGDHASLARSIVSILTDPSRAQSMAESGYQLALNLFDAKTNASRTFAVYEEILGTAWS